MVGINIDMVSQALDEGFSSEEIEKELLDRGFDKIEISDTLQSISQPEQITPISLEQLEEPVIPIEIPDPLKPSDFIKEPTDEQKELITENLEDPLSIIRERTGEIGLNFFRSFILPSNLREFDPQQVAAEARNIHQLYRPGKSLLAIADIGTSRFETAQHKAVLDQDVMNTMRDLDFEVTKVLFPGTKDEKRIGPDDPLFNIPTPGSVLFITDPNRPPGEQEVLLTSNIWRDMVAAKGEVSGSVLGGLGGFSTGMRLAAAIPPVGLPGLIAKGAVIAGVTLGLGALGAGTGRIFDTVTNSLKLGEDIEKLRVAQQALDAGVTDIIYSTLGAGVLKLGAQTTKLILTTVKKGVSLEGVQLSRALKEIKQSLNLSDFQVNKIMQSAAELRDLTKISPGEQLRILSLATEEGAELLRKAATKNMEAAMNISRSIRERTKGLLELASKSRNSQATSETIKDLIELNIMADVSYEGVKNSVVVSRSFGKVKVNFLSEISRPFRFKINPITNPRMAKSLESFLGDLEKELGIDIGVEEIGFRKLLHVRTAFADEFRRLKPRLTRPFQIPFEKAIETIDKRVARAVKENTKPGIEGWFKGYKDTLVDREEWFKNQNSALIKALTAEGSDPDTQIKTFVDFFTEEHGIYSNMINRLPKFKDKIELEVINSIINDHTVGDAIKFPELVKKLGGYNFTNAEAKKIKFLVAEMDKVYSGTPVLANLSASFQGPASSGIGTNLIGRLFVSLSSATFKRAALLVPTRSARQLTLADQLIKVFKNPLNNESVIDLMKILEPDIKAPLKADLKTYLDSSVHESLTNLMVHTAKQGNPELIPMKKIYSVVREGKKEVELKGKFGWGTYYTKDRKSAVKKLTLDKRIKVRDIPEYQIAGEDLVLFIIGKPLTVMNLKEKSYDLREELLSRGFRFYEVGNEIIEISP